MGLFAIFLVAGIFFFYHEEHPDGLGHLMKNVFWGGLILTAAFILIAHLPY